MTKGSDVSGRYHSNSKMLTKAQRRTIRWLVDNGYGYRAVQERYGIDQTTISHIVKQERASCAKSA